MKIPKGFKAVQVLIPSRSVIEDGITGQGLRDIDRVKGEALRQENAQLREALVDAVNCFSKKDELVTGDRIEMWQHIAGMEAE